jgi:ABC-2 type transport system permease protein
MQMIWEYWQTYLKRRLTYRADFFVEIITDFMFNALNLLFIIIVFQHTHLLGSWTKYEVIFVYGFFMIPYGIFTCIFNLWDFTERYVVKGEMDRVLMRPINNLVQIMLENIDPSSLFGAGAGAIIMAISGYQLGLTPGMADLFIFLLFTVSATAIYVGIYVSLNALSFFTDSPTGIGPMIWNVQNYGRYPVDIYNRPIKVLLTWVLPFAFVGIYPSAYFLHKQQMLTMAWITPVVGAVVLTIGISIWNFGVRKYRGAGS